ncbi:MAG: 3-oxoacyl-ACP reductase [Candidatus Wallbacteria bacterium HGW-Wallbacteria-1]|jgi:3-oxoacyl-[acyl-carrier protein] reductase|uniref:3-oxoacyl-ACP reductase n=1 Tax=Candidatus Wallbacteria bacterium HGW-Wallbacteria-1 TaxID=2013854 RepID=A0A2N1PPV0_9BACT|nr:MAG: 3-oxoacyl-ACP reductase [Candidatus Wallbacteria bacterium HGW-Wallbacteria-1]
MLSGKTILITGGSGDLGQAICHELLMRGARVIATYNRHSITTIVPAQPWTVKPVELMENSDSRFLCFQLDVTNTQSCEKAAEVLNDMKLIPQVLIYNSGITRDRPVMAMEDSDWQEVMNTNLFGAVNIARTIARFMTLKRGGKIFLVSSAAGQRGGRGQSNYAASKAGLEALGRSLAAELARKEILVNMIAPGPLESRMTSKLMENAGREVLDRILLGRLGKPAEIARFTAHMCSDDITYITGQTFHVDGGFKL